MAISDGTSLALLPSWAGDIKQKATWMITRSEVRKNGVVVKENFCPSLERLTVNDYIGIKRTSDGSMHFYLNGEDIGVAATGIPRVS